MMRVSCHSIEAYRQNSAIDEQYSVRIIRLIISIMQIYRIANKLNRKVGSVDEIYRRQLAHS